MTKPNLLEGTKEKLQKFHWPVWFPYPSSWLKAIILLLFLRVIIFVVETTGKVGYSIAYSANSPELFVVVTIVTLLSPIPILALTHHVIHLFIGRLNSQIQAPEIGNQQGILPGIISLWEGLYGWLVLVVSTLLAMLTCTFLLPFFNLSYLKPIQYYTDSDKNIIALFGLFWVIAGALIYQLEFLFKRRLLSAHSVIHKEDKSKDNLNSGIDLEIDKLRGDMGLTQINKGKSQIQTTVPESERNLQKYNNFNKKLLFILLIPLVAVGIYLFSKLSVNQNNIPLPIASQTQLLPKTATLTPSSIPEKSPVVLPQTDNFREAVNKAVSAANLTQSAKFKDDWKTVMNEWQTAIELMKTVPTSSSNYAIAQQKIIEYQQNLNYAQKNAIGGK